MNKNVALAAALASAFALSACGGSEPETNTSQQAVKVKCEGINMCAGQGACEGTKPDGTSHTCAGKNACAGQGWLEVPEEECLEKGGTVKA